MTMGEHATFARDRRSRLREQLARTGEECWRAGQLIVGFLAAGMVFSAPPQPASRIFTPEVMSVRSAALGPIEVVPIADVEPGAGIVSVSGPRDWARGVIALPATAAARSSEAATP